MNSLATGDESSLSNYHKVPYSRGFGSDQSLLVRRCQQGCQYGNKKPFRVAACYWFVTHDDEIGVADDRESMRPLRHSHKRTYLRLQLGSLLKEE